MKKLVLPLMIVAIAIGLYEQTKSKPNIYILIVTLIVFMYGMMRLSAKTLHHDKEEPGDNSMEEEQEIKEKEDDREGR